MLSFFTQSSEYSCLWIILLLSFRNLLCFLKNRQGISPAKLFKYFLFVHLNSTCQLNLRIRCYESCFRSCPYLCIYFPDRNFSYASNLRSSVGEREHVLEPWGTTCKCFSFFNLFCCWKLGVFFLLSGLINKKHLLTNFCTDVTFMFIWYHWVSIYL